MNANDCLIVAGVPIVAGPLQNADDLHKDEATKGPMNVPLLLILLVIS